MKSKLLISLTFILSGGLFGCSQLKQHGNTRQNLSVISKKIEQRIPTLKYIQTTQLPRVWNCKEEISAAFFLWKTPRYRPAGEFPREPKTPSPYADMFVTIAKYDSAEDAMRDLKKSLHLRQATFQHNENYRRGTLYQYRDSTGAVQNAICQSHQYIVEVQCLSPAAKALTMKVMDTTLAQLDSF